LFLSTCNTCPTYQILDEECKLWLFPFCSFLQHHFTSSLTSLHTLCSTPISSFNMWSYVWHQHQIKGKVLITVYSETCLSWNFFCYRRVPFNTGTFKYASLNCNIFVKDRFPLCPVSVEGRFPCILVGWDSVVSIMIRYGLQGLEIKSWWGEVLHTSPDWPAARPASCTKYPLGFVPAGKAARAWPLPSMPPHPHHVVSRLKKE
jgi:hypothetical protein